MRIVRWQNLGDVKDGHIFKNLVPGRHLCLGGLSFHPPKFRAYTNDEPDGKDYHAHENDHEVFMVLQGKGFMELNGKKHPLVTGDVCVVEPGEDHHLIADSHDPCVVIWLHAGNQRHPDQIL